MRILLVTDYYRPGNSRLLTEYAGGLGERGHQVILLGGTENPADPPGPPGDGSFDYRPFPYDPVGGIVSNFLSVLRGLRWRWRAIREEGSPDRLIMNQPFSGLILDALVPSGTPRVYVHHAPWHEEWLAHHPEPPEGAHNRLGAPGRWLNVRGRKALEGFLLGRCDAFVVLSELMRGRLSANHPGLPDDCIHTIPGGVDLEDFHPGPRDSSVIRRLGIGDSDRVLLTLRRLVPRTGVDQLIDCFGELVSQFDPPRRPHLVIGGTGPLEEELRERARRVAADRIHFAGFVPDGDLPELYRSADLFLVPTRELEGFGLVTLEALASGVPVLATDVGGSREILAPLDPDLLLPPGDPGAWVDRMARFLEDPGRSDSRNRYRTYVEENYSWDRSVVKLEALLQDLQA